MMQTALSPKSASAKDNLLELFQNTATDVYIFILYGTRNPDLARDLTVDVFSLLLRRQKALWWRKDLLSPVKAIKTARKLMRRSSRWRLRSAVGGPLDELIKNAHGKTPEQIKQVVSLHNAVMQLPTEQREIAVLGIILKWSSDDLQKLYGEEVIDIERRHGEIRNSVLRSALKGQQMIGNKHADELSENLINTLLVDSIMSTLKDALLIRLESSSAMLPLRSFSVVALLLLLPIALFSVSLLIPAPLAEEVKQTAALELILAEEVYSYDRAMAQVEESLKGVSAHIAMQDVEKIAVELAAYALEEFSDDREELDAILNGLKTPLISSEEDYLPLFSKNSLLSSSSSSSSSISSASSN